MAACAERGVAVESHPRLLDQRPAAAGSRYDDGPMVHGHFGSLPRDGRARLAGSLPWGPVVTNPRRRNAEVLRALPAVVDRLTAAAAASIAVEANGDASS